ncbi:MAG: PD-(D/E)XK nuclease domain-containing protein [Deltaproteobacteria bacterium]|jgi:hypothetical protein|nr:PD-(D/E)XK nuclease domain-containing protein [Deltaproteobacteria bacterium]
MENLGPSSSWNGISALGMKLKRHLSSGDVPGIVDDLLRLFVGIIYSDRLDASHKLRGGRKGGGVLAAADADSPDAEERKQATALIDDRLLVERGEGFYRSILHAAPWVVGAKVTAETRESLGRPDLEADCGDLTYVIELKMVKSARGGASAVKAGKAQMLGKGYGLSPIIPSACRLP